MKSGKSVITDLYLSENYSTGFYQLFLFTIQCNQRPSPCQHKRKQKREPRLRFVPFLPVNYRRQNTYTKPSQVISLR
jgi:hypothetical protein